MQAELLILRLSRNSGVLGLAGMPFTSQIFPTHTHSNCKDPTNHGILLVRPLLEFFKEDMYKVGKKIFLCLMHGSFSPFSNLNVYWITLIVYLCLYRYVKELMRIG
jgi:hypothetical protein